MKQLIYIKGSDVNLDVRLVKFLKFFTKRCYDVKFWGWSRNGRFPKIEGVDCQYLLQGGGYGKKSKLFLFYFLWVFVVFIKCLFSNLKDKIIIAIDFDSALPVYWASKFKKITYLYEVYDDFALRYKFPSGIKKFIHRLDERVMHKSEYVIHVDENRVIYRDCKWIIIENTPNDIYDGKYRDYCSIEKKFAVVGLLSEMRGVSSILDFAKEHPDSQFLVVGRFINNSIKDEYVKLPNVDFHEPMPQEELYSLMKDCCAIFSLYDPCVDINKLAASNKVYDAMMHGIPVITNPEVVNSKFIIDNNIGFTVNYSYDETWQVLCSENFLDIVKTKGSNGRAIYLEKFLFDKLVESRLVPILEKCCKL